VFGESQKKFLGVKRLNPYWVQEQIKNFLFMESFW